MRKKGILFYFKTILIVIGLLFLLNTTYSCDYTARKFGDIIQRHCREFNVEPALIFAVAETESHFNPHAESIAGAIGIMQIMPNTAEWIASSLNVEIIRQDLYDPEINIRFATFYLSYLFSIFDDPWQVIAAYNAGEGRVREWIKSGITSPDNIPLEETVYYVEKVERALSYYRKKKFAAFD